MRVGNAGDRAGKGGRGGEGGWKAAESCRHLVRAGVGGAVAAAYRAAFPARCLVAGVVGMAGAA